MQVDTDSFDLEFATLAEEQEAMNKKIKADKLEAALAQVPVPTVTADEGTNTSEAAPPEDPGAGFLGTVADIGTQLLGGVRDAGAETLQTVNDIGEFVTGMDNDLDFDAMLPDIDDAETGAGAFARGTAQFLTGFVPALGAMRALKATKLVAKGLSAAKASGKLGGALTGEAATAAVAGAMADFTVFDPHEERLSNLAQEHGFDNAMTQYLAADPNDSAMEGRFKSVLEGAALGLVADGIFNGVKFSARWAHTQAQVVSDNLVTAATRTKVHAAGAKTTFLRQNLADLYRARDEWVKLGEDPLHPVVAEARGAVAARRTDGLSEEAAGLIEGAEFRAGQSGRNPLEEFEEMSAGLNASARAESPLGVIEAADPDLAAKIRDTSANLGEINKEIDEAHRQLVEGEEEWYDAVTDEDWRENFDDVRFDAEGTVDNYLPLEVAEDVARIRKRLDGVNCA
jgi:hypothetical protein